MAHDVPLRSADELAQSRRAAQLAADVLAMIEPHVVPGVSTEALDKICFDYIVDVQRAIPANVGYKGFPKTICIDNIKQAPPKGPVNPGGRGNKKGKTSKAIAKLKPRSEVSAKTSSRLSCCSANRCSSNLIS